MLKRKIFSSPLMFITAASEVPDLLTIPAFAPLRAAVDQYKTELSKKGCNCQGKRQGLIRTYKGLYEAAFSSLQDSDRETLKRVLNTKEVCYYVTNNQNVLELRCF